MEFSKEGLQEIMKEHSERDSELNSPKLFRDVICQEDWKGVSKWKLK